MYAIPLRPKRIAPFLPKVLLPAHILASWQPEHRLPEVRRWIAPIAVVSSPGITTTCTPVVSSRATTASTCSWVAPGVITTITVAT